MGLKGHLPHPLTLLAQGQETTRANHAVGRVPHGHGLAHMGMTEVHWNIN